MSAPKNQQRRANSRVSVIFLGFEKSLGGVYTMLPMVLGRLRSTQTHGLILIFARSWDILLSSGVLKF